MAMLLAICTAALIRYDRSFYLQSWELLRMGSYGRSEYERAAFIVRDTNGMPRFVAWPYRREAYAATYYGKLPASAVAIIHTHPNYVPYPSEGDAELARRTGLPVYVVTRSMISRTDGDRLVVVRRGDWRPSLQ